MLYQGNSGNKYLVLSWWVNRDIYAPWPGPHEEELDHRLSDFYTACLIYSSHFIILTGYILSARRSCVTNKPIIVNFWQIYTPHKGVSRPHDVVARAEMRNGHASARSGVGWSVKMTIEGWRLPWKTNQYHPFLSPQVWTRGVSASCEYPGNAQHPYSSLRIFGLRSFPVSQWYLSERIIVLQEWNLATPMTHGQFQL